MRCYKSKTGTDRAWPRVHKLGLANYQTGGYNSSGP